MKLGTPFQVAESQRTITIASPGPVDTYPLASHLQHIPSSEDLTQPHSPGFAGEARNTMDAVFEPDEKRTKIPAASMGPIQSVFANGPRKSPRNLRGLSLPDPSPGLDGGSNRSDAKHQTDPFAIMQANQPQTMGIYRASFVPYWQY